MKYTVTYDYDITIQFILNNETYDLKTPSVKNIVIDHDYINRNMPIIFCRMNIDLALYKTILDNENSGKFLLIIKKKESNSGLKLSYIKEQFKYFIPTNRNEWNTEFTTKSGDETTANTAYKETLVGLMSEKLIDNNSKIFNGIYSNTTSSSLVHMGTKHMKMVIEPFKNNYKISQFVIPPMESVSEFLSFINTYYPFYDTSYRYFLDFDCGYLISSNGTYIDKRDNNYNTINIDIQNRPISDDDEGMVKDTDAKSYYLNTYLTSTGLKVNIYLESLLNTLNTIDIDGIKNEEILDLLKEDDITKHYKFQRVVNTNCTNQLKHDIENSIVTLSLFKADIDTSVITPNKIYNVKNFKDNKKFDGRYILTKKQDVFTADGDSFSCTTTMELKRIKNT